MNKGTITNEGYYLQKSGDRVSTLLSRHYIVPTLSSPPDENTLTWNDDSYVVNFRIGEFARIAADDGYLFYRLNDINGNKASWQALTSEDLSNYYTKEEIDDLLTSLNPTVSYPDWNATSDTPGFIENRTHYYSSYEDIGLYQLAGFSEGDILISDLDEEAVYLFQNIETEHSSIFDYVLHEGYKIYIPVAGPSVYAVVEKDKEGKLNLILENNYGISNYIKIQKAYVAKQLCEEFLPEQIARTKDVDAVRNSIIGEDGYVYSNGEKVDMRFTRSLLPVGTAIPASANLNTIQYLKIGKYYCSLNVDAETITYCPVKVAFSMEVFNPLGTNIDDETTREYTYRLRVLTQHDSGTQYMQFCKTSGTAGSWTYGDWYAAPRTKATLNSNKKGSTLTLGSATQGVYVASTGVLTKMTYTLGKSVPSNAVFTDTNTKVTAVENHYTPSEDVDCQIDAAEGEMIVGLKMDAAGHIVGIATAPAATGGGGNITDIVFNGESLGASGVIDLGDTINQANYASDLNGRAEATPEVFTYRASAGNTSIKDSSAVIRRIKGNSVVWNQQINNQIDQTGNNGWWVRQGASNGVINDDGSITINWNSGTSAMPQISQNIGFIGGHKYFTYVEFEYPERFWNENNTFVKCRQSSDLYGNISTDFANSYESYSNKGIIKSIHTAVSDKPMLLIVFIDLPDGNNDLGYSSTFKVSVFDLTLMFGTGNEPTTVEEFRALYPDSYYPYNAGEIRNLNCSCIKTVGFNQWDEQWERGTLSATGQPDNTSTTIRSKNYIPVISDTDYYVGITSDGFDDIYYIAVSWYDSNKNFISRTYCNRKVVKSPTNAAFLKFGTNINTYIYGNTYHNDICINLSHTGYRNGEYEPYKEVIHELPISEITGEQPLCKVGNIYDEINTTQYIKRVGKRDYRDGDNDDKTLITDGTTTLYPLQEQIVTPLQIPFDFSYYVEDFGTEEAISSVPSASFSADIVYQFNAVDRIRQNDANITKLDKKVDSVLAAIVTTLNTPV